MTIKKAYIDKEVKDKPETLKIISRLKATTSIVNDNSSIYDEISNSPDPVQAGKERLFLTKNRGAFIKECPGTTVYTCCGYKILHIGTFCVMDCSYCILQAYFHPPILQFFVNHQDMMGELDALFQKNEILRIGTGEFTDSLIWEKYSDISRTLINRFAKQKKAVLELKTKTIAVNSLPDTNHNRKTIIAWSLNTPRIIKTEERNTASLSARFKAAKKCESKGYPIAFHFDPIIIYEGCEKEYQDVIKQIFANISPDNIPWISLGSFRFMPSLKTIIEKRFFQSKIVYGEFIRGLDNKMRYFKPIRLKLYRKLISLIKELAPQVLVYFCMEDDEVWQKTIGFLPKDKGGLPDMLDKSAARVCGLDL